jgi:hypothetical protein
MNNLQTSSIVLVSDDDDDKVEIPPPLKVRLKSSITKKTCHLQQSKDLQDLASILSALFKQRSTTEAISFLSSRKCSQKKRKNLGKLAGLAENWINCNQGIKENVLDLAQQIVSELYEPFWFYRSSLLRARPAELFELKQATPPLELMRSFWRASRESTTFNWLPSHNNTFSSVVHFVQAGSGTGVHVGNGKVLTCAHVVESKEDDGYIDTIPVRIGRQKVIMFASGRTFLSECCAQLENVDGSQDCCCVSVGMEIDITSLSGSLMGSTSTSYTDASSTSSSSQSSSNNNKRKKNRGCVADQTNSPTLAAATLASIPPKLGTRLFCVGNPSSIDLESCNQGTIEFEPPCWHASVGNLENMLAPEKFKILNRGRPPTRKEHEKLGDTKQYENALDGVFMEHTCWTYWGHSGAPLFDESGALVGLHCAWDPSSGIRHGQKLYNLQCCLAQANDKYKNVSDEKVKNGPQKRAKKRRTK